MKNIIWQMGDGRLAYFSYHSEDVDTQALAVEIKAANGVDADWTAVAFDKDLPASSQEAWRLVDGEVVIDETLLPAEPVPAAVTMRQARLALLQAGMLATVNSAIAAMPGDAGAAARIEWEFSSEVQRQKPLVLSLAPLLNLSAAQLDALFIQASKL